MEQLSAFSDQPSAYATLGDEQQSHRIGSVSGKTNPFAFRPTTRTTLIDEENT